MICVWIYLIERVLRGMYLSCNYAWKLLQSCICFTMKYFVFWSFTLISVSMIKIQNDIVSIVLQLRLNCLSVYVVVVIYMCLSSWFIMVYKQNMMWIYHYQLKFHIYWFIIGKSGVVQWNIILLLKIYIFLIQKQVDK